MESTTINKTRPVIYRTEFLIGLYCAAVLVCVVMDEWLGVLGFAAALVANLRAREFEKGR